MKNFKKILIMAMICLFTIAMPLSVNAAAKINKKTVVLIKGQSTTLKISGTTRKVKWSSDNNTIATVTQAGKITAKKRGQATITAKVGTQKLTCKVTVEYPRISTKEATIKSGKTMLLKITGTQQKITWRSNNPTVAKVNTNGRVRGRKAGYATITATINGKKYTCKIKVVKPGKFSSTQLKQIGKNLGVPASLNVEYVQDTPRYWDAGERYLTYVQVLSNDQVVASVSADSTTGELVRNIWMYTKA